MLIDISLASLLFSVFSSARQLHRRTSPYPSKPFQDTVNASRLARPLTSVSDNAIEPASPLQTDTPNWAGVVLEPPPEHEHFTGASGRFVVPRPGPAADQPGSGFASAAAWIGLNGNSTPSVLLQAGVSFAVYTNVNPRQYVYYAWYQWLPGPSYNFTDFPVTAGDHIHLNVHTYNTTYAHFLIENKSTKQKQQINLTAPNAALDAIPGKTAEWIVEDYSEGPSHTQVPFASFSNVTFEGCQASVNDTKHPHVGLYGATEVDLEKQGTGERLANGTVASEECVVVEYVAQAAPRFLDGQTPQAE